MRAAVPGLRSASSELANVTAPDYIFAVQDRLQGIVAMDSVFDNLDVLVMPTVAIAPPRMDEIATTDAFAAINARALRNTSIWNFFDVCAISLPIRLGNALPVGLMLVGRHGEDRKLLAIAAAVEKMLGT